MVPLHIGHFFLRVLQTWPRSGTYPSCGGSGPESPHGRYVPPPGVTLTQSQDLPLSDFHQMLVTCRASARSSELRHHQKAAKTKNVSGIKECTTISGEKFCVRQCEALQGFASFFSPGALKHAGLHPSPPRGLEKATDWSQWPAFCRWKVSSQYHSSWQTLILIGF